MLVARRGPAASAHDDLQAGVEAMREAVDGQLTPAGRERALSRLERVRAGSDASLADVAAAQADLLRSPAVERVMARPGWAEGSGPREALERLMPMRLEGILVRLGLLATAALAVFTALVLLAIAGGDRLDLPQPSGPVELPQDPIWAVLLFAVATVVGIASGVALALMLTGRARSGVRLGTWATLANLVAGGLLTFYVAQFEAMASALLHLALLLLLLNHGRRLDERRTRVAPATLPDAAR